MKFTFLLQRQTFHKILVCFIKLVVLSSSLVQAQPIKDTLFINSPNGEYPLYKHFYIYKSEKLVSPEFIYDSTSAKKYIRLYPEKAYSEKLTVSKQYWLLFIVKNKLEYDETFYCQMNSNMLNVVKDYRKNIGTGFTFLGISGCDVPFKKRIYSYTDVVFPLSIKPGETVTILMSIDDLIGEDLHFFPQLRSENIFKTEEEWFYTTTGLITGLMLAAFLLNIFLALSLKENIHFLYAAYILSLLFVMMAIHGTDIQYLYPNYPKISLYLEYISIIIWDILVLYVMQRFLNQKKENSKLKRYVDLLLYAYMGMIVVNVIIYWAFSSNRVLMALFVNFLYFLGILQAVLVILSPIEKIRQNYKPAWFYLAGIVALNLAAVEFVFMYLTGDNQERILKSYPNDIEIGIIIETLVVFFGIVYRYNLYKQEKEKLMLDLNTEQQNLIQKIVGAEEAERKRIAEDLHDDVGATLSTLYMYISNAKAYLENKPDLESYYQHSLSLSNKAAIDIRNIAHNLLPKDFRQLGLFTILNNRIDDLNESSGIRFNLITEGDVHRLKDVMAVTIYRIINELLANICKHAMAAEAAVQILIEENNVQIMVEDDGIGYDDELAGMGIGLKNVKSRVEFLKGTINIDNRNGTQTIINLPI